MTDKLQIQEIEREMIFEFITEFLDSDPDYDLLSQEEKDKTFGIYQTILSAIYKSSFYNNIYPIIYATDTPSKKVVENAIKKISDIVPDVNKITVSVVN